MKYCKKCVLHDGIKGVIIGNDGICNYCSWDMVMNKDYPISSSIFNKQVDHIRKLGKGRRYDAVIGLSGGTDSSYLLKLMVDSGVRCLGVHFDNNWNTRIAWENMVCLTDMFGVDFRVRHVDPDMYDSLCKSFLYASTPDADIPNDIALASVLYQEAEAEDIPFILDGHSFRTEGTCPTGWTYMDGLYIKSVNKQFLNVDLSGFPNMLLRDWLRWLPIQRPRLLYYVDYVKPKAKEVLKKLGWSDYGGHHMENRYTVFIGTYLWGRKFGQDLRYVSLSAMIRNGHIGRDEALRVLKEPLVCPEYIVSEVKSRLGFSDDEFDAVMNLPVRDHCCYETYDFSRLGQVFGEFRDVLPKTFLDKYVDRKV
jgi:hypothetical protein